VPLPAFVIRVLFGEMGRQTVLCGQLVEPRCLRSSGFAWSLPGLPAALSR
jgi:NAD dependent epimerase/dehydratase family enzyme